MKVNILITFLIFLLTNCATLPEPGKNIVKNQYRPQDLMSFRFDPTVIAQFDLALEVIMAPSSILIFTFTLRLLYQMLPFKKSPISSRPPV